MTFRKLDATSYAVESGGQAVGEVVKFRHGRPRRWRWMASAVAGEDFSTRREAAEALLAQPPRNVTVLPGVPLTRSRESAEIGERLAVLDAICNGALDQIGETTSVDAATVQEVMGAYLSLPPVMRSAFQIRAVLRNADAVP